MESPANPSASWTKQRALGKAPLQARLSTQPMSAVGASDAPHSQEGVLSDCRHPLSFARWRWLSHLARAGPTFHSINRSGLRTCGAPAPCGNCNAMATGNVDSSSPNASDMGGRFRAAKVSLTFSSSAKIMPSSQSCVAYRGPLESAALSACTMQRRHVARSPAMGRKPLFGD